jgi:hypothetical protein
LLPHEKLNNVDIPHYSGAFARRSLFSSVRPLRHNILAVILAKISPTSAYKSQNNKLKIPDGMSDIPSNTSTGAAFGAI